MYQRRCISVGAQITPGVADWLKTVDTDRSRWLELAKKIHKNASAVCQQLGLPGTLELFGSAASGFGSATSDVDLVFVTSGQDVPSSLVVLRLLEGYLRDSALCHNVTQIYQGRSPVLKLTHDSGIEVDIVVNNNLGLRNTRLFKAYHDIDVDAGPVGSGSGRIGNTVRALKEWARRCGLIGTCDGMINSFAFTILVLYYLQVVEVLPNLQTLAVDLQLPSEMVEHYEACFADPSQAPPLPADSAPATATVGALMYGFFLFYSHDFDWTSHAVSMRLAAPRPNFVSKAELKNGSRSQWYIEDPFMAGFNLAHGTNQHGRDRMFNAFSGALQELQAPSPEWQHLCPEGLDKPYSNPFEVSRIFVKTNEPEAVEVYVQFDTWQNMRGAQSVNEQSVPCCEHLLALYISLGYGLLDDIQHFRAYPGGGPAASLDSLTKLFSPLPFPRTPPGGQMSAGAAEFVPGSGSLSALISDYDPPEASAYESYASSGSYGDSYTFDGGAYGGHGAYGGNAAYDGSSAYGGKGAYGGNSYDSAYGGYGEVWPNGEADHYPPYYGNAQSELANW